MGICIKINMGRVYESDSDQSVDHISVMTLLQEAVGGQRRRINLS